MVYLALHKLYFNARLIEAVIVLFPAVIGEMARCFVEQTREGGHYGRGEFI